MSTIQKIIKALAIALAVFIIFSIVSFVSSIICGIAGINWFFNWLDNEEISNTNITSMEKNFDIEEIRNLDLSSSIENVEILSGNEFKVIAENVPESFKCEVEENTLIIDSNTSSRISINNNSSIKVYVPEGFIFNRVNLNLDVGETRIDFLKSDILELKSGAGSVDIKDIEANQKATITCGVGEFDIKNSKISNLEFNSGVGRVSITSELSGKCSIETGVGEVDVNLINFNESLSKINTEKGIGELRVNGRTYSGNQEFGLGNDTIISVKGGIGEINIEF